MSESRRALRFSAAFSGLFAFAVAVLFCGSALAVGASLWEPLMVTLGVWVVLTVISFAFIQIMERL